MPSPLEKRGIFLYEFTIQLEKLFFFLLQEIQKKLKEEK